MSENLAKAIYEHYEKYLGEMLGADSYPAGNLQLMGYQDAVQGCLTFATLGLTLHQKELGACCEAVLTVEEDLDTCADLFVKTLFYLIAKRIPMGPGLAIGGIDRLNPEFFQAHGKSALYFTEPTLFAPSFRSVGENCSIYMGFFISPEEEEYLRRRGKEAFERKLETEKVDIIDLNRPSAV